MISNIALIQLLFVNKDKFKLLTPHECECLFLTYFAINFDKLLL